MKRRNELSSSNQKEYEEALEFLGLTPSFREKNKEELKSIKLDRIFETKCIIDSLKKKHCNNLFDFLGLSFKKIENISGLTTKSKKIVLLAFETIEKNETVVKEIKSNTSKDKPFIDRRGLTIAQREVNNLLSRNNHKTTDETDEWEGLLWF